MFCISIIMIILIVHTLIRISIIYSKNTIASIPNTYIYIYIKILEYHS